MRTHFDSLDRPKRIARVLAEFFPALKLMQAQEWVAQICGYRNWHDLREVTSLQSHAASLLMPQFDWEGFVYKRVPESAYDEFLRNQELAGPLFEAQVAFMEKLLEPYGAQKAASDTWELALNTDPDQIRYPKAIHPGKGAALYEELQRPWFVRESHLGNTEPQEVIEDLEWTVGDSDKVWSLTGYEIWCGFKNRRQLDRYLANTTGHPAAMLSMMRQSLVGEDFDRQFPLDGGGSDIRVGVDSNGHQVIEQSTRYRYWAADQRHRVAAQQEVMVRVTAWANAKQPDQCTIVLGEGWCGPDRLARAVYEGKLVYAVARCVSEGLEHFVRCRVAQDGAAIVNFICFDNPHAAKVFGEFQQRVARELENEGFPLTPERFKVSSTVERGIPSAIEVSR